MSWILNILNILHNDVAEPWQLGFQDSAAPGFSGIEDLHDTLGFYLIIISISVFWVLFNIIYYYNSSKNAIAYKYLTHGSKTEPIYFSKLILKIKIYVVYLSVFFILIIYFLLYNIL